MGAELEAAAARLAVPVRLARLLFDELAMLPLAGPFLGGNTRYSAINGDGIPFEWSASVGPTPGGLRFLVDHGTPGTSITARTRQSLRTLARLLDHLGVPAGPVAEYESVIRRLCPAGHLLDRSLMGVWIGVGLDVRGGTSFKVYVNQRVGDFDARYFHLSSCLAHLERFSALETLEAFVRAVGDRVEPGLVAVEFKDDSIRRVKLYVRALDTSPAFLGVAAESVGCRQATGRLDLFNRALKPRASYGPRSVILALEFAPEGDGTGFKVYVNCARLFNSDQAAHRCVLTLLEQLGLDGREYRALLEVCAPRLSDRSVERLMWVGTGLREEERRVNVYLHPGRE